MKHKVVDGIVVYQCSLCHEYKPVDEMYLSYGGCKKCGRARRQNKAASDRKYKKDKFINEKFPERKESIRRVKNFIKQLEDKNGI